MLPFLVQHIREAAEERTSYTYDGISVRFTVLFHCHMNNLELSHTEFLLWEDYGAFKGLSGITLQVCSCLDFTVHPATKKTVRLTDNKREMTRVLLFAVV